MRDATVEVMLSMMILAIRLALAVEAVDPEDLKGPQSCLEVGAHCERIDALRESLGASDDGSDITL